VADPLPQLAALSQFLGHPSPSQVETRTRPLELLPNVEAAWEACSEKMSDYLERFGYERRPHF